MKFLKSLVLSVLLAVGTAHAQVTPDDLMGLGMPGPLAEKVAAIGYGTPIITSTGTDPVKIKARDDANRIWTFNAASDAALTTTFGDGGTTATQQWTVSASTADADDDSTIFIAGGGAVGSGGARGAYFSAEGNEVSGGGDAKISSGVTAGSEIELFQSDDANRKLAFSASADDALALVYGDGGTTATQGFAITAGTADADDDADICLSGGGACETDSRGAWLQLFGNEAGSSVLMRTGDASGADIRFRTSDDFFIQTIGGANLLNITDAAVATFEGTILSAATSSIGWAVVAGADTACNTTCTSACVFGVNTAATEADIVACTDATADECLCAGAS